MPQDASTRGGGFRRLLFLRSGFLFVALLAQAACGAADGPASCFSAPRSCDAGKTCWPTDMGGSFQCLPSKAYAPLGSDCALLVGLTTCADGLICAPMTGAKGVQLNRCTQYCDGGAACPAGATCSQVSLFPVGPQVAVCLLPAP
jgi:hypothetical protein